MPTLIPSFFLIYLIGGKRAHEEKEERKRKRKRKIKEEEEEEVEVEDKRRHAENAKLVCLFLGSRSERVKFNK